MHVEKNCCKLASGPEFPVADCSSKWNDTFQESVAASQGCNVELDNDQQRPFGDMLPDSWSKREHGNDFPKAFHNTSLKSVSYDTSSICKCI
ncbi:hypothetical protein RJT34_06386 [Clitoria ternatea]|uniref:Uncharacterized protein n=1 Tax=Clitoria ternatea TaxID=43366 RepID=A0AAN9PRR0_CLITE